MRWPRNVAQVEFLPSSTGRPASLQRSFYCNCK